MTCSHPGPTTSNKRLWEEIPLLYKGALKQSRTILSEKPRSLDKDRELRTMLCTASLDIANQFADADEVVVWTILDSLDSVQFGWLDNI